MQFFMFLLSSADFFEKKGTFQKILSGTLSERQWFGPRSCPIF